MKYFIGIILVMLQLYVHAQVPHPMSGVNMKKNAQWLTQRNGKTVIQVTWDNPSPLNEQERNWVKSAIEATWEKYANIDFVDWGPSDSSSKGIRITIEPSGWPHTKGLGTMLDGVPGGMVLTFDFQGTFTQPAGLSKEDCIKFIAVHEFGHALGFAHEHNRPDCLCNEKPQGDDGGFLVTPCDLHSVMNYCNPQWTNYGKLSTNDIVGAQLIYGRPQSITISAALDEIRLIPCNNNVVDRLRDIKKLLSSASAFSIGNFSEENGVIPQEAVDKVPGEITIRFFYPADLVKAIGIKKLLTTQGYYKDPNSIIIEDKMGMNAPPNYIEIWTRETIGTASTIALDEIRFVPCTNTAARNIGIIKNAINNSTAFNIKAYSEETKIVPAKAVSNLPNITTIRFFDSNDEAKALELRALLGKNGYDAHLISVENMISVMNKLYPGYVEIWTK